MGDRALEAAAGGAEGCVEVDQALLAAGAEVADAARAGDLTQGAAGDLVGAGVGRCSQAREAAR